MDLDLSLNVLKLVLALLEACYEKRTCFPEFLSVEVVADFAGIPRPKFYEAIRWVEAAGIAKWEYTADGWVRFHVTIEEDQWRVRWRYTNGEDAKFKRTIRSGAIKTQPDLPPGLPDVAGRQFAENVLNEIQQAALAREEELSRVVTDPGADPSRVVTGPSEKQEGQPADVSRVVTSEANGQAAATGDLSRIVTLDRDRSESDISISRWSKEDLDRLRADLFAYLECEEWSHPSLRARWERVLASDPAKLHRELKNVKAYKRPIKKTKAALLQQFLNNAWGTVPKPKRPPTKEPPVDSPPPDLPGEQYGSPEFEAKWGRKRSSPNVRESDRESVLRSSGRDGTAKHADPPPRTPAEVLSSPQFKDCLKLKDSLKSTNQPKSNENDDN